MNEPKFTNRLVNSSSSYLRQHAHNPVDWFPWGQEAFDRSRNDDKPILLSIGYSTCHWCHVMMHESFESEATAAIMNEHFINVKVDREELPTVDQLYQAYIETFQGEGGWPLTIFCTPHLKPFFGGTYFPPLSKPGGIAGFPTILTRIAKNWKSNNYYNILQNSIDDFQTLKDQIKLGESNIALVPRGAFENLKLASKTFHAIRQVFDFRYGGILESTCDAGGCSSKFPRASVFRFLLAYYKARLVPAKVIEELGDTPEGSVPVMMKIAEKYQIDVGQLNPKYMHGLLLESLRKSSQEAQSALEMVELAFTKMSESGIRDHVGGGFHRYTVDKAWKVPHFEKMLYDQGQLLVIYTDLFSITKDPLYETVARQIVQYVDRELKCEGGAFCGGQDADSKPQHGQTKQEGCYYLWDEADINTVLGFGEDSSMFKFYYGIKKDGNIESSDDESGELIGKNVLAQAHSITETAKKFAKEEKHVSESIGNCLASLLRYRKSRPQPIREERVATSSNGIMISSLARAGRVFNDKQFTDLAIAAATFIRCNMYRQENQVVLHQLGSDAVGYATDFAFLIDALLELYASTFDDSWLKWAVELQHSMDTLFWDDAVAGYFSGMKDERVLLRMKEDNDKAEPAAGSIAVLNLLRLDAIFGTAESTDSMHCTLDTLSDRQTRCLSFRDRAKRVLLSSFVKLSQLPRSLPVMMIGVIALDRGFKEVVIQGDIDGMSLQAVMQTFDPFMIFIKSTNGSWLMNKSYKLKLMSTDTQEQAGKFQVFICDRGTCFKPADSVEGIQQLLA
ncbi:hypothetical protein BDR26DRAFT_937057 [Obelidium mucronatum]|nr:hypothetical protein BDR26DRAFT_937057 [Obelidium mucronatum]